MSSGDIKQQWKAASDAEKLHYIHEARLRPKHRLTRAEKAILDQWMPVPVPVDVRSFFLEKHAVVKPPFSPAHHIKSASKKFAALTEREMQQLAAEHHNAKLEYISRHTIFIDTLPPHTRKAERHVLNKYLEACNMEMEVPELSTFVSRRPIAESTIINNDADEYSQTPPYYDPYPIENQGRLDRSVLYEDIKSLIQ